MRVQERVRRGCEREVCSRETKGEVVRSSRVVKVALDGGENVGRGQAGIVRS